MAVVKPFRALRFNTEKAGDIKTLVCPPYDIISEEQRLGYIERNPNNVIRLELPKGEKPYEQAAELLEKWESEGILALEDKPAIYIYEEEFTAYGQTKKVRGIICRVHLEEFEKGIVLPHEFTLSKAKQDRFNLMSTTNCNFSQIYSLYMDDEKNTAGKISALASVAPEIDFDDGAGVIHRLWTITDPATLAALCSDFNDRKLYIADGHHRYETALNYRNHLLEQGKATPGDGSHYVMMMLVDMQNDGLVVFPTHRMVRDLESFDAQALCEKAKQYFEVTKCVGVGSAEAALAKLYAENKKAFAMYAGGDEYTLFVLRDHAVMDKKLPDLSPASRQLDVAILHTLILEEFLGIDKENMAQQINLTYTKTFDEAIEKVRSGEFQCSFILNPTRVTEIRDVAAADEKMPQKSTYFYPKLITGLVMNKLSDKEGL
ncbi:MAG: DUF1015 domain-containing protein [Clostridia bacterium]|nr:DUF1015 domain-containing protein [Clostridia bacterium]